MNDVLCIVLAAGEGTRMKSSLPKVLHPLAGRPMLLHVLDAAEALSRDGQKIVVLGKSYRKVSRLLDGRGWEVIRQKQRLGTGHAVRCVLPHMREQEVDVIVLNGDTPLLTVSTLRSLLKKHRSSGASMTMMTACLEDPKGYGRIVRDEEGRIEGIVEQKELGRRVAAISEVNGGVYAFKSGFLKKHLPTLKRHAKSGEYYLTDLAERAFHDRHPAESWMLGRPEEALGVNSRGQLAEASAILYFRTAERLMDRGVSIIDPRHTYIDATVKIGRDTVVYPGSCLEGYTRIGRMCMIGPHVRISNSSIGDRATIKDGSVIESSVVKRAAVVGPMACMCPKP